MSPSQESLSFETHSDVLTSSPGENRTSPGPSFLLTRDFGFIWWSQLLSQVADGVSKLALLWFVYSITGSPLKTTIVGVLQTVPPILFGPFIGVLVDRFSKKSILIVTDLIRALLIGVVPCLIPAGQFTVESLYVLVFLYGVATAMFVPTLSSSIPFMVSRPQFTAANALLQSTTSIGIIMGPLVSGVGIALSGSQEVLCLNAVTYLASVACLLPIRLTSVSATRSAIVPQGAHWIIDRGTAAYVRAGQHRSDHADGVALYLFRRRVHNLVPGLCQNSLGSGPRRSWLSLVMAGCGVFSCLDIPGQIDRLG